MGWNSSSSVGTCDVMAGTLFIILRFVDTTLPSSRVYCVRSLEVSVAVELAAATVLAFETIGVVDDCGRSVLFSIILIAAFICSVFLIASEDIAGSRRSTGSCVTLWEGRNISFCLYRSNWLNTVPVGYMFFLRKNRSLDERYF